MISSILITSCTSVKIKDNQFCGDLGDQGAHCNNTLSKKPVDIPKPEWDKVRFGWICTNSDGFENWKTAIQSLCEKTNMCTYEMQQQMQNFFQNIDEIKSRAKQLPEEKTRHIPKG